MLRSTSRRGALAAAALCLVTGCREPIRPSEAVQIAVLTSVRGIKPGYSLAYSEGQLSGLIFEPIVERDSLGDAIPRLAKL